MQIFLGNTIFLFLLSVNAIMQNYLSTGTNESYLHYLQVRMKRLTDNFSNLTAVHSTSVCTFERVNSSDQMGRGTGGKAANISNASI